MERFERFLRINIFRQSVISSVRQFPEWPALPLIAGYFQQQSGRTAPDTVQEVLQSAETVLTEQLSVSPLWRSVRWDGEPPVAQHVPQ